MNVLMSKLSNLVPAAMLRKPTPLSAVKRQDTRWSSSFNMVDRYMKIRQFIGVIKHDDVSDLKLSAKQDTEVEALFPKLCEFQSVTKEIQSTSITFADVKFFLSPSLMTIQK